MVKNSKSVRVSLLIVLAVGLALFTGLSFFGKELFGQTIIGQSQEDNAKFQEAVGELPAMAKVEAQTSPYGEDQTLNFAPVFADGTPPCTTEPQTFTDPVTGAAVTFGCNTIFEPGVWLGDIPAGQTVLIVDIEKKVQFCRVLGVSLQGWDVDGWIRCDRLGPM